IGFARGVRRGHDQADALAHAHVPPPGGSICPDHSRWHARDARRALTLPEPRGRMAPGGERKLFRVGVDIGGTFTDLVFLDESGRLHTKKVSSSVDDYARAIIDGLGEVFKDTGITGAEIAEVLHGTTVASNAVLEQKGARTGLITTRGF